MNNTILFTGIVVDIGGDESAVTLLIHGAKRFYVGNQLKETIVVYRTTFVGASVPRYKTWLSLGVVVSVRGRVVGTSEGKAPVYQDDEGNSFSVTEVAGYSLKALIDENGKHTEDEMFLCIAGHLGQDPSFQYTEEGTALMNISVATNSYSSVGDTVIKETIWWRVGIWGPKAESLNEHKTLHKGSPVYVEGLLVVDESNGGPKVWTSKKDGTQKANYELKALVVRSLAKSENGNGVSQVEEKTQEDLDEIPF